VGIGASAGGLAAIEALFSAMPADADGFGRLTAGPGMAFVLVQHLAPDHKSILTDLIRRYTRMKVREVEDGMAVQPNCAYIIPPNRDMAFLSRIQESGDRSQKSECRMKNAEWGRKRAGGSRTGTIAAMKASEQ
jgi:chemotaxis response regulator CheB